MLKCLGKSEYGLFMLIGSFVGYIAILDFGLGNTIIRYVAKYRAQGDEKGQENFLAMCISIYCAISLLAAFVGVILYYNLGYIFTALTPTQMGEAKLMFGVLIFNLAITLPLNAFKAIITGYERFVMPQVVDILRVIIRSILLVVLLRLGFKAVSIVILDTVLNIAMRFIFVVYVFSVLKTRIKLYSFDIALFGEVFSYSIFIFINMIADQIYWRLGQIVLGIVSTTAAVAVFAIGMQFCSFYMQLSSAISGVLLPKATKMSVNNASNDEMTDVLIKTGRIQLIILYFVLGGFLLYGRQFVMLWVGKDYIDAWLIGAVILIPLTVPLVQGFGLSLLQAKRMHGFRSVMYVVIALVNGVISVFLAKSYGSVGAALGTTISLIAGNIIVINIYYKFKVGLNIIRFFKELIHGLIPAMICASIIGVMCMFLPGSSWGMLIIRCSIYAVAYCLCVWFIGMNRFEKALIYEPVNRLFKDRKVGNS
jgi:O-antigen/teichoic acid export membrane protein